MSGECFELRRGGGPLLVSVPHSGTTLPPDLRTRLSEEALQLPDTDWRVDELYDFLDELDVTVIRAKYSRYVVDLNRPPSGASLYPGQLVSEICPLRSFAGAELYLPGLAPSADEVSQRVEAFWQPYHRALRTELKRLRGEHGHALLWDAHSIRAEVPRLFAGTLPDLNFGTADGVACDSALLQALEAVAMAAAEDYSWVSNGRFKGGAITRLYGRPRENVHAVQLELSQAVYLEPTAPFLICERRANALRGLLRRLLQTLLNWKPGTTGGGYGT